MAGRVHEVEKIRLFFGILKDERHGTALDADLTRLLVEARVGVAQVAVVLDERGVGVRDKKVHEEGLAMMEMTHNGDLLETVRFG